ncbi:hypothetical protein BDZ45DRAFT_747904 [Acephala macrosclerotiorum]|nr:hypothetical protein BDZ45DRAFT_747904 [Acephala macrosclerotiorum]
MVTQQQSKMKRFTQKFDMRSTQAQTPTIEDLKAKPDLWYRLKVLIKMHISAPYFTAKEAEVIKVIIRSSPAFVWPLKDETTSTAAPSSPTLKDKTNVAIIEKAIQGLSMQQRAVDINSYTPHDLRTIYLCVFQIEKSEMEELIAVGLHSIFQEAGKEQRKKNMGWHYAAAMYGLLL